jgi:hypothetical protein
MFIKMTRKWHCVEFDIFNSEDRLNLTTHVENGNIVVFADEVECFAKEMDIDIEDIEMA